MHAFGDVGRDVGLIAFQHYWLRARQMGIAAGLDRYALNELAARAGRMHRGGPITAPALPAMPSAFYFDSSLFAGLYRQSVVSGKSVFISVDTGVLSNNK